MDNSQKAEKQAAKFSAAKTAIALSAAILAAVGGTVAVYSSSGSKIGKTDVSAEDISAAPQAAEVRTVEANTDAARSAVELGRGSAIIEWKKADVNAYVNSYTSEEADKATTASAASPETETDTEPTTTTTKAPETTAAPETTTTPAPTTTTARTTTKAPVTFKNITPRTLYVAVPVYYRTGPTQNDPIMLILMENEAVKVTKQSSDGKWYAAEAHGLKYKGKMCGSFGDITAMSFYPNKHITTGEGGMVLTDDDKLRDRSDLFRNLCHMPGKRFHHELRGHNFRMSNIQAAVGVAQLEKIEDHLKLKRELGAHYQQLFKDCEGLKLPVATTSYAENIYWVFGLVLDKKAGLSAEEMIQLLAEEGIGCRPFFWPMHKQPIFTKMGLFKDEEYPVADYIGEYGFYVPSGLTVSADQRAYIAEAVKKVLKSHGK